MTKLLVIGPSLLAMAHRAFSRVFENRPAVIVADTNTFPIARSVADAFKHAGHECIQPFVFSDPKLYAEHEYVEQLQASLATHSAIPIAVGSGTINDLTKLAAHRTQRPYMSVATAASMDGYTAFGASITHEGSKQTFDCPAPAAVLADLDVIASAPPGMNAWGYADLLAKITAGADWIVADELGVEPINPFAWKMVQENLRTWTGDPDGVRRGDREAVRSLVYGLMMSGFAMQTTSSSRPASGAEHQFSHLWDMEHATTASHGAKVGVATVAVAKLYEALLKSPIDQIDVEAILSNWQEIDAVEVAIDELFSRDMGLRPMQRTSPPRRVTGNGLVEKAKQETRAKHPTHDQLRQQLAKLRERWPDLRHRISNHLLPSRELSQMLAAAGAPNRPDQIGIAPAQMRQSFRRAYHIRRRFTVLDLAVRTGMLERCIEGIAEE